MKIKTMTRTRQVFRVSKAALEIEDMKASFL